MTEHIYSPKHPDLYPTPEVKFCMDRGGLGMWNLAYLAGPHLDLPRPPIQYPEYLSELHGLYLSLPEPEALVRPIRSFLEEWMSLHVEYDFRFLDPYLLTRRAQAISLLIPSVRKTEGNVEYVQFGRKK